MRGLFFLAVALMLPSSSAQAGSRALRGDTTVMLDHDHISLDQVLGSGIENSRRTSTQEASHDTGQAFPTRQVAFGRSTMSFNVYLGPVAVTQLEPASDGSGSRDALQGIHVARTRDYLNALVDASVSSVGHQWTFDTMGRLHEHGELARKGHDPFYHIIAVWNHTSEATFQALCLILIPQLGNLAFLKTHKTGSTTLSSLFYRYGVRHGLKILEQCNGRVDIMHYHIGTSSSLSHTWSAVAEQYKTIMRDPSNINFVTIFREPRSHFLSYYYYFVSHKIGNRPVEKFLLEPSPAGDQYWQSMHNPAAGELGITTQRELDDYVKNALPKFKLVLLTDRFAEGLMLLRKIFGWHMIDMTYVVLNQTGTRATGGKKQGTRKPGAQSHRPSVGELSIEAQNKIDELTRLDRAIYEAGRVHFEQKLAPLAGQVIADVAGFNSLQELVYEYLSSNRTSSARNMYSYEDFFLYFPPSSAF